jgi:hypothetical protein
MRARILPLLLLLATLLGCNSSSNQDGQASPVIYDFHPGRANLNPGTSTLLLANFAGGAATVDQGIGVIVSGVPVSVSPSATRAYTLTVKGAKGDPAVATTTITVGPMSVDISPSQVGLAIGQTQAFNATVAGLMDTRVQWSATGGSITNRGVFTAGGPPGTYLISAQSLAEPTLCAKAFVTVQAAPIVITVNPPVPIVTSGRTLTLTAQVTGTTNAAVTWSASAGSITPAGAFTAPAATGTVTVTATSVADPSRSASTTVTVVAPPTATSLVAARSTITVGTGTTVTPTFANGTAKIGTTGIGSSDLTATTTSGVAVATGTLVAAATFTMTVTNAAGDTATATSIVAVVPAATATLAPSTVSPLYRATNVTVTPTFTNGTAVVGTSQGASNLSAGAISGAAIAIQATGFTAATTYWVRVTNSVGDFVDASATITPQTVVVATISPANPTVSVSTSTPFFTSVSGGALGTVTWSSSGGSWSGSTWTAPATAGSYTITATSNDDATKTATTTATGVDLPAITAFTLQQVGVSAPTWALSATYSGGTGAVDQGVGALASGSQINVGLVHADLYTLTVTSPAGVSVTRTASAVALVVDSGTTGSVLPGRTYSPAAHVTGAANTGITYSTTSGSVTTGGVYSPPMAIGSYALTLTSQADPSVNAIITVNVIPLVMPQSQVVATNTSFVFRAPILGIANTAVTWSLTPTTLGTISAQGVFTSNGTAGSATVTATSVANPTVSGTAFLTVQANFTYTNALAATSGAAITTRRTQHALARTSSDLVLASGGLNGGVPIASLETFNSSGQFWTTSGVSLATARSRHTATLLPTGHILIAGGRDAAGNPLASAELYDPLYDLLAPAPGVMASAREDHTATLLIDGRVLLAGGRGTTGTLASSEIYDPVTNTFTTLASAMTDARVGHSAIALLDGRVLVAGGSKDGTDASLSITGDLFDSVTGTFTPATSLMNWGRRNMGAALAPDGSVSLLGGVFTPSVPLVYSGGQKFNPATSAFASFTSPLSTGRNRPLSTILANGTMLFLGGSSDLGTTGDKNGTTPTGTVDVFNPVTTVFPTLGFSLPTVGVDQLGGRCVLLADGTVLIVGDALNGSGAPVGSVLYQ